MFGLFARVRKIADLKADSEVIVQGKLVADKLTTVPGTDIRCAFFWMMTEIWDRITPGRGRKMWIPQESRQGTSGFYLDDGTGRVWISAEPLKTELRGGWSDGGPVGKKGTARYLARTLKEGDTVRATGTVTGAKSHEPGTVMVLRPGKKGWIILDQKKKSSGSPAAER